MGDGGQQHRTRTLTEHAAGEIRKWILDGSVGFGEPLSESMLAARFGYSKTPIREALLQLKKEGLISIRPQSGSFVFEMSEEEVRQLGEFREVLEVAALRRAMERDAAALAADLDGIVLRMRAALDAADHPAYRRHDIDFHNSLFAHTANRHLSECYDTYASRSVALGSRLTVEAHAPETTFAEHVRIAGLIAAGNVDDAAAALVAHIRATTQRYAAVILAKPRCWG